MGRGGMGSRNRIGFNVGGGRGCGVGRRRGKEGEGNEGEEKDGTMRIFANVGRRSRRHNAINYSSKHLFARIDLTRTAFALSGWRKRRKRI